MELIQDAVQLIFDIGIYLLATFAVLYVIYKLKQANDIIERARNIQGGSKYIHPMEEEAEYEEMSWKANA